MADLQEALDGVKSELATKKREEKDGRTREAQLGTQICTVSVASSPVGSSLLPGYLVDRRANESCISVARVGNATSAATIEHCS